MGQSMARRLLQAGHEVALWSHTAGKAEKLAAEGKGTACGSPRDVASKSECVFLCVGDTAMSREVLLGCHGVLEGAGQGNIVADCSTISPDGSREIAGELARKGVHFLDAPCTGSTPGATNGTLTFMIGGDQAVFDRAKPWFEPMGKLFYYCGGPGMGLQAKLTQNLVLANIMQAFSEGIVLATKAGVEPGLMLQILDNSAAKSGLISYKAPFVLRRDFGTNFSTKWMHKDIGLALDSGRTLDVPLPLTALTQQMLLAAISKGYGDQDFSSMIRTEEEWAGVEVKNP
jgi:3-hydroxyisobutyrate dehydrogenase-like beta-hydroxyacid dehydrogenase